MSAWRSRSELLQQPSPKAQPRTRPNSGSKALSVDETRERIVLETLQTPYRENVPARVSVASKFVSLARSHNEGNEINLIGCHIRGVLGVYTRRRSDAVEPTMRHSCAAGDVKLQHAYRRGSLESRLTLHQVEQLASILRVELSASKVVKPCCALAEQDVIWTRMDKTTVKRITHFWRKVLEEYHYARINENREWIAIWWSTLRERHLPKRKGPDERLRVWAEVFQVSLEDTD